MRLVTGFLCASVLVLPIALAEQAVVLKDGAVVKCQKYEVKGNIYVLTMENGKLQSMRADKVDADATSTYEKRMKEQAEAEAQRKAAGAAAKAEPSAGPAGEKGAAATSLTNEDLAKYKGVGGMGDETSVTAEKGEMPSRADYEKMQKGDEPAPKTEPKAEPEAKPEPKSETPPQDK